MKVGDLVKMYTYEPWHLSEQPIIGIVIESRRRQGFSDSYEFDRGEWVEVKIISPDGVCSKVCSVARRHETIEVIQEAGDGD